MKRALSLFLSTLVLSSTMMLASCAGGAPDAGKGASEGNSDAGDTTTATTELNVFTSYQMETMDYLHTAKTSDEEILANLVDGLLENDQYGKLVPALAESYEKNEDATVWTFKLKKGIMWVTNSGEEYDELKADDFVAALRHGAEFGSELSWLLEGVIKGYSEYEKSDFSDAAFEKVGVKALDDYTVQYTMEVPIPYFDSMTTYNVLYPVNRSFLESQGNGCKLGAPNKDDCKFGTKEDTILYNGGYILTENTPKSKVALTKNDEYWDADHVYMETVNRIYDGGEDPYATIKGFESGVYAQSPLNTSWEDYETYREKYKDNLFYEIPNSTVFALLFNFNRQSFKETNYANDETLRANTKAAILNENFRKALRAAFDRRAVEAVTVPDDLALQMMRNINNFPGAGTQSDGTSYYEEVQKQYNKATGENRNLDDGQEPFLSKDEALDYIAKAEKEGIKFPVHLDMLVTQTSDRLVKRAQSMKKSVEENTDGKIIIELVLRDSDTVENIAYRNMDPAQSDYDISTFTGWGPDYADPKSFVDTMSATTGFYMTSLGLGTVDKDGNVEDKDIKEKVGIMEFEDLYRKADAITDNMDERYKAFAKADAKLIQRCFYIPTAQKERRQMVSKYVPFSKIYSDTGISEYKYKYIRTQADNVTTEQYDKAYEEWKSKR